MGLDELLPRRHSATHQHVERLIGGDSVLDGDLLQRPCGWIHRRIPELGRVHFAETLVPLHLGPRTQFLESGFTVILGVAPDSFLPGGNPVERRLGDIEIAIRNDVAEIAEEKRQKQGANVRAINVGVRHDDDPVVAQFGDIELIAD